MGYRYETPQPPDPEDMLPRFVVPNGTITKIAFPCFYVVGHSHDEHDHYGWPYPEHLDNICQSINGQKLEPINFTAEGYNRFRLRFDDNEPPGSKGVGLNGEQGGEHIVVLEVEPKLTIASLPLEYRFVIFAEHVEYAGSIDVTTKRDQVIRGILSVVKGGNPVPELTTL